MGETKFIYAYDVGTGSVKASIIDSTGKIHANTVEPIPIYYPNPGWAEQDPEDYWKAIITSTQHLQEIATIPLKNLIGIVFTTQAMGIIPIDEHGNTLHRNITWVDGRAEKQARKFMGKFGGRNIFRGIVGIEITGKDVIPKLMWLKKEQPDIYQKTQYFLDVNGFLKFKATGKKVAEWSGACSYSFNLKKKEWTLLHFKLSGLDVKKLPPLVRSTDIVGTLSESAAKELNLPKSTAVFGGCDDTQSAAIGSTAIKEGEAHIYLGTSAWVGVSTRNVYKFKNGAVTLQSADPTRNLVVGITESAGSILEWIARELYKGQNLDVNNDEIFPLMDKEIGNIPPGSDHLIATPWVLGERCPVSTTTTRATYFNMSLDHTRAHLVKAINEGISYNLRWIIENFEKDFGFNIKCIKILGGGSQSHEWMQIIADVTQRDIWTVENPRIGGCLGAAMCGFVGAKVFPSFSEIKKFVKLKSYYKPNSANREIYNKLFKEYQTLYAVLQKPYEIANSGRF